MRRRTVYGRAVEAMVFAPAPDPRWELWVKLRDAIRSEWPEAPFIFGAGKRLAFRIKIGDTLVCVISRGRRRASVRVTFPERGGERRSYLLNNDVQIPIVMRMIRGYAPEAGFEQERMDGWNEMASALERRQRSG